MNTLPSGHGVSRALIAVACVLPLTGTAATLSTIQFNTARITSVQLGTAQDIEVGFSAAAPTATISRDTTVNVNGTTFTDQGFVEVSAEALRARGTVAAVAGPNAATYLSQATAAVQDGFRIDSATYNGQVARVEYSLDLSGLLEPFIDAGAGTPAIAGSTWRLSSGCQTIAQCAQTVYTGSSSFNGGLLTASGDSVGRLDFVLEVAFGTTVSLLTTLDLVNQLVFGSPATGTGTPGVTGSASADFTNTVVWGGIQRVTLTDGTVVNDWTTASGSGFDYGTASVIPLPPPAWLLGSALMAMGWRRRHRSWRPPRLPDGQ